MGERNSLLLRPTKTEPNPSLTARAPVNPGVLEVPPQVPQGVSHFRANEQIVAGHASWGGLVLGQRGRGAEGQRGVELSRYRGREWTLVG